MKVKLWIALDGMGLADALQFVAKTAHLVNGYKINDLWDAQHVNPGAVGLIRNFAYLAKKELSGSESVMDEEIFVDIKGHDTPETVTNRARQVNNSGADIMTVHASGGHKMIEAAVKNGPGIIAAVTLLTSIDDSDLPPGVNRADEVLRFALLAQSCGAKMIVCSAKEVATLAAHPLLVGVRLLVPGLRLPEDTGLRGQVHIASPDVAAKNGGTDLVLGSTVTKAKDPVVTIVKIRETLQALS